MCFLLSFHERTAIVPSIRVTITYNCRLVKMICYIELLVEKKKDSNLDYIFIQT